MRIEIPTLVKWAGGKKQLLNQFDKFFPKKIDRYIEPFLGGGAVAFYIIKRFHPKNVFLSDINEELVNAYKAVQLNVPELIEALSLLAKKHSKEFYYKIRAQDPQKLSDVDRAARLIYLNKTCFNGLYRVNSEGKFNVPIGEHKHLQIVDTKDLMEINHLLKHAIIKTMPFEKVLDFAKKGDFIYLDPPYYPLKEGKSFTKYHKGDFSKIDQERLKSIFDKLTKRGCKAMLSNSDAPFIRDLYKEYSIQIVQARRMINCDATKRGKINEVVVTNYKPIYQKTLID